ncbi:MULTISPECIES: mandelate racemase/muconate lactonizing enzyme family protein [unclassified Haladaptatus]|uniref:mandelate racemase/muconate lactonizing enzyme family protein n=1 Tax=unclassified Haladaptatus TaxID=2622732 RepID=UPI00209C0CDD|nr:MULTISPECIES: mandelate racemase/muconate lactonizing enzyme family protein [unclassified Haladaptatus]MCO8245375.1 mandelate racemase/muconate lactonizing enzyme family protein [Haladaptatus sp. AB643]MCO8256812.1 mandelate racemase/muconate lactonizing enzyme family protein [Haladaptatus sp. AB618]
MRDFSNHTTNRGEARDVQITDITTAVVEGNFEWNLIKIETDAGVTGIGESYRGGGISELVSYTKRFLIGENPLDVERLVRYIFQEMSGHGGTTGKVVTAASGIEVALWDVAGKLLDLPVYQLLGSKYRDEVRIYCDCHAGEAYAVEDGATAYAGADAYSPEAYANEARRVVDMGFSALKFDLDLPADNDPDPYNGRLTNTAIREKREIVEAVRNEIGYDIDLAFDCHWDYSVESAKRLAYELEEYDLMWLEDLVPPENMDAQIEVTRATRTPVATGENRFRVFELTDLIYEHGVDVVTPDPTTVGGLAETMRVADRAEENYIPMSPHNVCSPVGTMACVHLGAATPNFDVLEYHALEVEWWDDLLVRDEPLIQDGYIEVPEAPGLGIELDENVVEDHLLDGSTGF